jgi:hypothetical protein
MACLILLAKAKIIDRAELQREKEEKVEKRAASCVFT